MELTKDNTHGFYLGLLHENKDILEKWFKDKMPKYNVEEYAITLETAENKHKLTNGQHFHILIYSTKPIKNIKITSTNIQSSLANTFNLRGKSSEGKARQYGLASKENLRDPINYLKYILKDKHNNNILTKGLKDYSLNLDEWKEPKKEDKKEWFFELQTILTSRNLQITDTEKYYSNDKYSLTLLNSHDPLQDFRKKVAIEIIKIYREKIMKPPTKSQMDAFVKYYILHNTQATEEQFINLWYYREI